jgi:hypothetical protein
VREGREVHPDPARTTASVSTVRDGNVRHNGAARENRERRRMNGCVTEDRDRETIRKQLALGNRENGLT